MIQLTVSAPGKLMLLGEHSVVYNRPCLVTAVDHRLQAKLTKLNNKKLAINAPDLDLNNYNKSLSQLGKGNIPKAAQFVEIATKNFQDKYGLDFGLSISTSSQFKASFGFGSSSAAAVCTIKGLAELTGVKLSKREVFDLSYKTVLDVQGVGSGFDVAAAVYGGTLYFVTGGKTIESIQARQGRSFHEVHGVKGETLSELQLVVGYTGTKGNTATIVKELAERSKKNRTMTTFIYDTITDLVNRGRKSLEQQDWQSFGDLMRINHGLLVQLGVSTEKLDELVSSALIAGAYGAKLSGAGGGDCMIALTSSETKRNVEKAIIQAKGELINIHTSAPGVQLELCQR